MSIKFNYVRRFFKTISRQSYFLFGPRGTGKSSFLKRHYPKAVIIDFLDEATVIKLSVHPELLEPIVHAMKKHETIILDEVQRVPSILAKIHQIIESQSFPDVQFILTGSSARKLKKIGVDLLAGRAIVKNMYPFIASELGAKFNLEKALQSGLLPIVISSKDPSNTLSSYLAIYIQQEVKQEGLVRNLDSFTRFLEAISYSHGEVINLSNVARECNVKRSTVDGFMEILEDLLIGHKLKVFKKNNRKSTVEADKFYFFDTGVFKSVRPSGPLDNRGAIDGALLEGLVFQHLLAYCNYSTSKKELYYWRTQAGNEVDFILYGHNQFTAIEVKNNTKISSSMLSGLKSFSQDYPSAKLILLYRGKTVEKHNNVLCVPVEKFLLELIPD